MPEESGRWTDDGWLRTGDVATIDADGYIRIVDRAKDLIKSGGEWISPERNARRTGRGLSGGHELSRCGVMWPPTGLRRAHHEDTKITKTPEEDLPRSHRETEPPTRRTQPLAFLPFFTREAVGRRSRPTCDTLPRQCALRISVPLCLCGKPVDAIAACRGMCGDQLAPLEPNRQIHPLPASQYQRTPLLTSRPCGTGSVFVS